MKQVNLNKYNNSWYNSGSIFKKAIWYFTNMFLFKTMVPIPSSIKVKVLRLFGAEMGVDIVIKPNVSIKYPWFLEVGDYSWIGEDVWIDNLAQVNIGKNCILSQGAFLLTGSHDYTLESFDLITKEIVLEDGSWVGAKATVCPGVTLKSHSVLSVSSVATKDLEAYSIYQGNPAIKKRERVIK
jgi:putative colanic acid biosynthesis acetyltransferase WcaF